MKNICTFLKITIKSEVWIFPTNFLTNWTCDLTRFLNKINQGIFTTKLIDLNDSHRMLGKEQVAKNWEVNDPLTIISPFKKSWWRERQGSEMWPVRTRMRIPPGNRHTHIDVNRIEFPTELKGGGVCEWTEGRWASRADP